MSPFQSSNLPSSDPLTTYGAQALQSEQRLVSNQPEVASLGENASKSIESLNHIERSHKKKINSFDITIDLIYQYPVSSIPHPDNSSLSNDCCGFVRIHRWGTDPAADYYYEDPPHRTDRVLTLCIHLSIYIG